MIEGKSIFCTTSGIELGAISRESYCMLLEDLLAKYTTPLQICESASFSMAMVIRHALGLSASEGHVAIFFNDSLSGQIAVATGRHLRNAGASVHLITLTDPDSFSDRMQSLLRPFICAGISPQYIQPDLKDIDIMTIIPTCHNVTLGVCDEDGDNSSELWQNLIELFNEQPTPIHTIQAPLGINLDTGLKCGHPLFASSTLSLGIPLESLIAASDYVGRHYVCDISIPPELYTEYDLNYQQAFSEQPVIQVFPKKAD